MYPAILVYKDEDFSGPVIFLRVTYEFLVISSTDADEFLDSFFPIKFLWFHKVIKASPDSQDIKLAHLCATVSAL